MGRLGFKISDAERVTAKHCISVISLHTKSVECCKRKIVKVSRKIPLLRSFVEHSTTSFKGTKVTRNSKIFSLIDASFVRK